MTQLLRTSGSPAPSTRPLPGEEVARTLRRRRRRAGYVIGLLGLLLVGSVPSAVAFGPVDLDVGTVARIIGHRLAGIPDRATWDASEEDIVWLVRVPRVLLAVLVGAALAVCGVALQALVRNVLAEPYLLGVSSGASTGAALTLLFGVGLGVGTGSVGLAATAFAGALVAVGVVFGLARQGGQVTPMRLLLAGVAVGYVLNAATGFLVFASDTPEGARAVLFWLLGSLTQASWASVGTTGAALGATLVGLLWWSRALDALVIGDETAHALGARPARLRSRVLLLVALAVGAAVAVSGGIGFVGLVVPHVARTLVGSAHRLLVPVAALLGATFLVWADVVARTLFEPKELPIGIVTAVLGTPFLLVLVRRAQRETVG